LTNIKKYANIYLRKRKKGVVKMFNENKFKGAVVAAGKTTSDVADALNINLTTLYRKLQRDGDFSREEIQKVKEFLNLSSEEANEIFFADKLA